MPPHWPHPDEMAKVVANEFILGVFVTLKLPKFYRSTISNSPNVHLQEFGRLTGSGRTHCTQDENGRVTCHYLVQSDAQRAFDKSMRRAEARA